MGVSSFVAAPPLSLDHVTKALESLERLWKIVGEWLKVPSAVSDDIQSECSSDMECLRRIVRYWLLRDPFASWRRLICCLDWEDLDYRGEFQKVANSIRGFAEPLEGQ